MKPPLPASPGPNALPSLDEVRAALRDGTGEGVKIAVIDSGVEVNHPRLSRLTIRDSIVFEEAQGKILAIDGDGSDTYGHGTAVAGIVHEMAPEAEVGSFQVIDSRSLSRTHLICAGVREAIRRGYHILNCSFGCRGLAKFILPHKEWADEAWLKNIHVVAACNNSDSSEAEWPSHFSSVIAVDLADTPGDNIYFRYDNLVGFSARGENVEVAWSGGRTHVQTGTSFAAPRVTGAIARILSIYPHTPPSLMYHLLSSVSEPWHPGLSCDD